MLDRHRTRTGVFALLLLLALMAPAPTTPATQGPAGPAIDDGPGVWSWIQPLWISLTQWLSPHDSVTAATEEEPPPEEEDPFGGGGAGGGPGGGTGIQDPNG